MGRKVRKNQKLSQCTEAGVRRLKAKEEGRKGSEGRLWWKPKLGRLAPSSKQIIERPTTIQLRLSRGYENRSGSDENQTAQVTFTLFSEPIKWVVVSNLLSFGTCELVFNSVAKFLQKKIKKPFKTTADLFFYKNTKSSRFMKTKKWTSKSEARWEICARPVKQPNRQQLP